MSYFPTFCPSSVSATVIEYDVRIVVEPDGKREAGQFEGLQSAFGHRELDRTRLRIDKPDNRLARLNPLVVVGIDFLDGTRERRDQLRVG